MKLEKIFEVKNNRLYKIGGGEVSTAGMAKRVAWSQVEPTPGEYDEAFLAALRDELKALDERGSFVYIDAVYDRDGEATQFVAAMKHCARRIKDCVSVAGFSVPERLADGGFADGSAASDYMRELSQKHGQYVYFCKKSAPDVVLLH